MLPESDLKKEWEKWLRHPNPDIARKAFKLAQAYGILKSGTKMNYQVENSGQVESRFRRILKVE